MNQGNILKSLIKKSDFTQRKIAEQLGIKENYFSMLLRNAALPDNIIDNTCAILGIDRSEHFELSVSNVNELQEEYGKLKEKYLSDKDDWLTEKSDLLNQIQNLIKENKELRDR